MSKIDKSKYSKEEVKRILAQKRFNKSITRSKKKNKSTETVGSPIAFVIGNGVSRKHIKLEKLQTHGKIYGCNALYREFSPDVLIAVDVKMIVEIIKNGYNHKHEVWTNPNEAFKKATNLNYFKPAKGWSSGPTALWKCANENYKEIYILGFDYQGLNNGKTFNNIYANTHNYKKLEDSATFYGNWLRQTVNVIQGCPTTKFYRVIDKNTFTPKELLSMPNLTNIYKKDFLEIFKLNDE